MRRGERLWGLGIVAGRLVVGVLAGLLVGATYWAVHVAWKGESLVAAARDEVEDARGLLEGVLILGALCGAWVGLWSGLGALGDARRGSGYRPRVQTVSQQVSGTQTPNEQG